MKIGIASSGCRALRRGRFSAPCQIYLITFTTLHRQAVFSENHLAAKAFSQALNHEPLWADAKLLCWVLMPDHVHLLVQLGENETLSKLMERLKSNTSRSVNAAIHQSGSLWQKGYHDRAMRSEDDVQAVARYVVMNPIRTGLVKSVGMYPYWNAIWI